MITCSTHPDSRMFRDTPSAMRTHSVPALASQLLAKVLLPWLFFLASSACFSAEAVEDELKTLREWRAAVVVSEEAVTRFSLDSCFLAMPVPEEVRARMRGKSYKQGCKVAMESLRYLRLLHRNRDGQPQTGEMVCHKSVAAKLVAIFRELYLNGYKIERMVLIDEYDADDTRSMTANNTSCFNYRPVAGTSKLSKHSQGLAVDINPLYNPCLHVRTGKVEPPAGAAYSTGRTRSRRCPLPLINTNDLCYRLFIRHGFIWGGAWRSIKDYQHFEIKVADER